MTKVAAIVGLLGAMISSSVLAAAAEEEGNDEKAVVLKLQAKKGDVFRYNVKAELTREIRAVGAEGEPLRKVEDLLEADFSQTCRTVERDGTMGFDAAYGHYKLVRKISEGGRTTKEVYTAEGLTIYDEHGLALSRKWSDMPTSEQSEARKVFARGFSFAMSPKGEIKELFESRIFEHELPWFHALRIQQAIYYPGYPIEEGTIWNWRKPVVFPELRDHPLSRKNVPTEREYKFIGLREVGDIPCATVSVQENSEFEDSEAKVSFSRRLVEKAHVEKATGMTVLVEGTLKTEISSTGLGNNTKTAMDGKFTISRITEQTPSDE